MSLYDVRRYEMSINELWFKIVVAGFELDIYWLFSENIVDCCDCFDATKIVAGIDLNIYWLFSENIVYCCDCFDATKIVAGID